MSQDHKKPDGTWNTYCPVWAYVPHREDTEALIKCMASYRDAFTKYLDQLTPRLDEELAAYRKYCQEVQPVLAREVFKTTDGWHAYREEKWRNFGFYLWNKAGFLTGLKSRNELISCGVKVNEDERCPRHNGVYCETKTLGIALTRVVRENREELKAQLGDFILSEDHKESDGSWNYEVPVWAYLPPQEDARAIAKRMASWRDAFKGYLDRLKPPSQ